VHLTVKKLSAVYSTFLWTTVHMAMVSCIDKTAAQSINVCYTLVLIAPLAGVSPRHLLGRVAPACSALTVQEGVLLR